MTTPSTTENCRAGSGWVAGPDVTSPVSENALPWQGHEIVPFATESTRQPWCVQTALRTRTSVAVGPGHDELPVGEDRPAADREIGERGDAVSAR